MEYLLIVNRFIPKSATKLTAGLASTAITTHFMYFFFSNQSEILFDIIELFNNTNHLNTTDREI
jgi:hypothetical protein